MAQLHAVELPAPSATFRTDLRAQLVAVAPRLIDDGFAEQQQATRARAGESRAAKAAEEPERGKPRIHLGRPLAVVTTVVAVCALVLGGAVWLSQKSLPGDTLYGLKRASESVQLKLDTNDTDRATDYLHFSQTRVEEAQQLLKRSSAFGTGITADGLSSNTAQELTSTLETADSQLLDGWKLLAASANSSHSSSPLAAMKSWAPGQIGRLDTLQSSLPVGSKVRDRAEKSTGLAHFALNSANTLAAKLTKPHSAPALPTTGASKHIGTGGSAQTGTGSAPANTSPTKTATANRPAPGATKTPAKHRGNAGTASSTTPKARLPSLIRPLVPTHQPVVSSCGISLPGGVKIGHCHSHS